MIADLVTNKGQASLDITKGEKKREKKKASEVIAPGAPAPPLVAAFMALARSSFPLSDTETKEI